MKAFHPFLAIGSGPRGDAEGDEKTTVSMGLDFGFDGFGAAAAAAAPAGAAEEDPVAALNT